MDWKIGDRVKVIDWGRRYEKLCDVAQDMGLSVVDYKVPNVERDRHNTFTIVSLRQHSNNGQLAGITCSNTTGTYIINVVGLKKVDDVPKENAEFNVGDKIKVKDWGKRFPSWTPQAVAMGLSQKMYETADTVRDNSAVFTIMSLAPHPFYPQVQLAGVMSQEMQSAYIMDVQGLELVTQEKVWKTCAVAERIPLEQEPVARYTATCRLRFPNGEEVECPAPPESEGWCKKGEPLTRQWPSWYVKAPEFFDDIKHDAGLCWKHDFEMRVLENVALVVWKQRYRKDPQPKKETETYTPYELLCKLC